MIDYDGRRFRKEGVGDAPVAVYRQRGDVVWTEVCGGPVLRCSVTGLRDSSDTLHMGYTIVLDSGDVICGHTVNTPEVAEDGRIRLCERWERYGPHAATGTSYLEEVGDLR
ncbi:MAG TPA: hypothetical protein VGD48_27025 [Kutzneria sp.]